MIEDMDEPAAAPRAGALRELAIDLSLWIGGMSLGALLSLAGLALGSYLGMDSKSQARLGQPAQRVEALLPL